MTDGTSLLQKASPLQLFESLASGPAAKHRAFRLPRLWHPDSNAGFRSLETPWLRAQAGTEALSLGSKLEQRSDMNPRVTITRRAKRRLCWSRPLGVTAVTALVLLAAALPTSAQERLCDNSFEDCRATIIQMIRAENVGLDVSMWFMTDNRYSTEIIQRWRAGVAVRILLDLRADSNYPANASLRQGFINAGIPIRHKTTPGINHWKAILYAGQAQVHFSAANFANGLICRSRRTRATWTKRSISPAIQTSCTRS